MALQEPKLYTLNEVLHDRIFRVPPYQRGYSWTKKQREDLFRDLRQVRDLLGRVEGTADTTWLGLRAGWWALIVASGVLSVVCQLLFWSTVVPESEFQNWRE